MSYISRYLDPATVEQLKRLELSARSVVLGSTTGLHRSLVKGASVDFRQHRIYAPGDEPRRLDWRVLARTDRPYIKEYEEETNLRCLLMLDCSGSMQYGPRFGAKYEYGARMVAAISFLMLQQNESIGLAMFAPRVVNWLKPSGGSGQLSRMIDALERMSPSGPSVLSRSMQDAADRLDRRALVVVLSDFFSPAGEFREGLARLRHDRHEVIALQVTDRDEEEFPFSTWKRFRGLEGEAPYLSEPALVKQAYLDNFRRHRQRLKESCQTLGAEFDSFVTDRPLMESLQALLKQRTTQACSSI